MGNPHSPDVPLKLQAALFLMTKKQMSILECEAVAKDMREDMAPEQRMCFDLVGPKGRHHCKWVDPFYGTFEIEGKDSLFHTKQFQYVADVHVENVRGE